MKQICIMVAAHKDYEFPQDSAYLPIHVGKTISDKELPFTADDSGENISELNKSYCELTGLYWLWKNKKADIYGLAHYRRYFRPFHQGIHIAKQEIIGPKEIEQLLSQYSIVLAKRRNYWIETVKQHYANAHHASDLAALEQVITQLYPEYLPSFNKVMDRRTLSLYNMFAMRAEHFDAYCSWLFAILFEVQKQVPYTEYGPYQGRVFGFMGERLLNVWASHNFKQRQIKYLSVINLEGENLTEKAIGLLKRKLTGIKPA